MTTSSAAEVLAPLPAAPARLLVNIVLLVAVTVLLDAVLSALTAEKLIFLYKEQLDLNSNSVATLNLILGIPGYARIVMGAGSDMFPLFGYYRRSYYVISALLMAVGFWGLSTLHQYAYATVACLLLVGTAGSTLFWVIVNAVMVTVGNRTGTFGRLQAFAMFVPLVLNIAYLSHFGGYVTEHWSYSRAFSTAALLSLLYVPFVFLLEDTPATPRSRATPEEQETQRHERAERMAIVKQAMKSPGMWAILGFIFYLQVTPYINTARTYYQTDVLQFSKQFIGDLNRYSSMGYLLGIVVFHLLSRRLSARAHVWGGFLGSAGIYVAYMGMRDKSSVAAVLVCAGFCINYAYLCLYTLGARVCPPGAEGTVYALILTAISSSYLLSEKFGSFLYDYFGPGNTAHHYTITHGWYSALWFGLGFTLLAIVFLPFLPAWARSKQPLLLAGEPDAKA